jgi:hypothetical protein
VSLGIMIKGSEGMVLAADSRVTLLTQFAPPHPPGTPTPPTMLLPATFDNATKVLTAKGQDHVGAVTFGVGALIPVTGPRTMHSFMPEFEKELETAQTGRLSVKEFAEKLSAFFLARWNQHVNRSPLPGEEINFLVGGYDEGAAYGRGFSFAIPNRPTPDEQNGGPGKFGITWGGQNDVASRLLNGYDVALFEFMQSAMNIPQPQIMQLKPQLDARLQAGIPYQFLPLQDCVDLATFLIKSTIEFQKFRTTVRGVGGHVDVATITREGFQFISKRKLIGSKEEHHGSSSPRGV